MHSVSKRPRPSRARRTAARSVRTSVPSGRNKAPKISTGQTHWDRPTTLTGTLGIVARDSRWSK